MFFVFRYEWPKQVEEEYDSGRYSPVLLKIDKLEPGVLVVDPSEDAERLEFMQKRLLKSESEVFLVFKFLTNSLIFFI